MIDNQKQVTALMQRLNESLPLPVKVTNLLIDSLRSNNIEIPLGADIAIVEVIYLGDEGGICCSLNIQGLKDKAVVVSMTHLSLPPSPLALDVRDYQAKRIKKLARQR